MQVELLLEDAIGDVRKILGIKKWPEPTTDPPDMETMQEWLFDFVDCEATDGCIR